jgi:transcriptional regulator with XRE-family HTH domain
LRRYRHLAGAEGEPAAVKRAAPSRETFGKNLKRLRQERGLSQEEFALLAGISRAYIGSLERGAKASTLDTVDRAAIVLGVHPSELLVARTINKEARRHDSP